MNLVLLAGGADVSALHIVSTDQIGPVAIVSNWLPWMVYTVVVVVVITGGVILLRQSRARVLRKDPRAFAYRALCAAWGATPTRGNATDNLGALVIEQMSEK